MHRRSPLGLNMGALNTGGRGMGNSSNMVVETKANMGETNKGSPASGAEKENWLFECRACLASFKREKYLREHKRNCQPNIVKRTLQVTGGLSLILQLFNSCGNFGGGDGRNVSQKGSTNFCMNGGYLVVNFLWLIKDLF